jgi:hypothetical protein
MGKLRLSDSVYLRPTPAGAFFVVAAPSGGRAQRFLFRLLQEDSTPWADEAALLTWSGLAQSDEALTLVHRMQESLWVEALAAPRDVPEGLLEEILPDLLTPLSSAGKAVLADAQGFYVATQGFAHETAEELSALSADLASLHERHAGLLNQNLSLRGSAWAVVDAAGHSQVGFWPLYVGANRFVLAIAGIPMFNRQEFIDLVWVLVHRYAGHQAGAADAPRAG